MRLREVADGRTELRDWIGASRGKSSTWRKPVGARFGGAGGAGIVLAAGVEVMVTDDVRLDGGAGSGTSGTRGEKDKPRLASIGVGCGGCGGCGGAGGSSRRTVATRSPADDIGIEAVATMLSNKSEADDG